MWKTINGKKVNVGSPVIKSSRKDKRFDVVRYMKTAPVQDLVYSFDIKKKKRMITQREWDHVISMRDWDELNRHKENELKKTQEKKPIKNVKNNKLSKYQKLALHNAGIRQ